LQSTSVPVLLLTRDRMFSIFSCFFFISYMYERVLVRHKIFVPQVHHSLYMWKYQY